LFLGLGVLGIPLFRITVFLCLPQIIIAIIVFQNSVRLFSTWSDKKRKMHLLLQKNSKAFSRETFKIFMSAPCSRLIVKSVLKDLGKKQMYTELLVYKEPLWVSIKNNFTPIETKIYINEDFV
jgi:hypothetical protein